MPPKNKGTLDNIDYGISELLKKNNPEQGVKFLENLLLANPDELSIKTFNSAGAEILSNRTLFSTILTQWFQQGVPALCSSIQALVGMHHGETLTLEIDAAKVRAADSVSVIFLARKVVGYLFYQPITSSSLLISIMRQVSDVATLETLGNLLLDPILLSFTGRAREYVLEQAKLESGQTKETLEKVLKELENYLAALKSVGDLPALRPGEAEREAYQRHFSSLMTESFKAAQAESVFLQLVSKSILLYGRKSIHYRYSDDGKAHRTEMPLHSHGTEFEYPRMDRIDPYGLDYMLRVFKVEKIRA